MAVSSTRTETIAYSGDVVGEEVTTSAINANSPGQIEIKTLASGANTITVPTGGAVAVAVIIIPPVSNVIAITIKGIAGDTGIRIHNTDPTVIAIDPSVVSFVLNAASTVTGLRLKWA